MRPPSQVLLTALAITAATVGFIFALAMTTSFDFTRWGQAVLPSHLLLTVPCPMQGVCADVRWARWVPSWLPWRP